MASADDSVPSGTATRPAGGMDEEEVELMRNFGEHELMGRVQAALKKQLTENLLRVEAELRRQEETREAAKKAREDVGVELYGVQQQLARIQLDLEVRAREAVLLQENRTSKEDELKRFEAGFAARKAQVEQKEGELEKLKGELDGINDTIRQVEKYNEEMSAQIALTRRATYKANEQLEAKEAAKQEQDRYIDYLNNQIRHAAEHLALLQSQKDAQRSQSDTAIATMAEANSELETIEFEKKQLQAQWQSSIVAMRKRDEVVMAQQKSIEEAGQALQSMDAEEFNLRKATAAAQGDHAKLQDNVDRERADLKYIETQIASMERQYNSLEAKQEDLSLALSATDAEIKRMMVEQGKLLKALAQLDADRGNLDRQRFGIDNEIAQDLAEKLANEKAAKALLKDAAALVERLHSLEMTRAETENAIASAKVEALNVSARVGALRDAMAALDKDLGDKERTIERYEGEIKARTDTIEKKMSSVDRLNRKWEKMVEGAPDSENMGPLQAEVSNLQKQIAAIRSNCDVLQRRWLADQTQLVTVSNDSDVKATHLRENTSQATLLQQKRMRLDAAIDGQKRELKRLEVGIKAMHDDMARITALIAKNSSLSAKLHGATEVSERSFSEELKDMEREAAQADARVASLHDEKARLLEELVETERQVVLWEKKIQLERETQEALDPSVGVSETAAMEKEIQRMRARYEALKRDQERLVAEMERAIAKREVIAMKHRSARAVTMAAAAAVGKGTVTGSGASLMGLTSTGKAKGGEGDSLTRIGLQQRAAALKKDIQAKLSAAKEIEDALAGTMAQSRNVSDSASVRSSQLSSLEARAVALQRDINGAMFEKQKAVEQAAALSKLLQRLEALEAGKLPPLTSEEALHARARLQEAELIRDNVRDVVARLADMHGELADVLDRVAQLVDTAPQL